MSHGAKVTLELLSERLCEYSTVWDGPGQGCRSRTVEERRYLDRVFYDLMYRYVPARAGACPRAASLPRTLAHGISPQYFRKEEENVQESSH